MQKALKTRRLNNNNNNNNNFDDGLTDYNNYVRPIYFL